MLMIQSLIYSWVNVFCVCTAKLQSHENPKLTRRHCPRLLVTHPKSTHTYCPQKLRDTYSILNRFFVMPFSSLDMDFILMQIYISSDKLITDGDITSIYIY